MRLFHLQKKKKWLSLADIRRLLEGEGSDLLDDDQLLRSIASGELLLAIYNGILVMYLQAIESIEDQIAVWEAISRQTVLRRTIQELPHLPFRANRSQQMTLAEQVTERPLKALQELRAMQGVYMRVLGRLLHWHRRYSLELENPHTRRTPSPSSSSSAGNHNMPPSSPSPTSPVPPPPSVTSSSRGSAPNLLQAAAQGIVVVVDVPIWAKELYDCLANAPPLPRAKQELRADKLLAILAGHTLTSVPSVGLPPGRLARSWVPLAACACTLYIGMKIWRGYKFTEVIEQAASNIWIASVNFFNTRILEPAKAIYATIRYDQSSLNLLPPQTVHAEEESLLRMVSEYGRERLGMRGEALSMLEQQVTQGDLTAVLQEFEKDIKAPIASFFFGDVLRMAIIQVQKGKVDVSRAMRVLDKLMKSNELTFHMISLIPALFMASYALRSVLGMLGLVRWSFYSSRVRDDVRAMVLELARIVNNNSIEAENDNGEEWVGEGRLLILVHRIAIAVRRSREFNEDTFMRDLDEVIMFGRRGVGAQNNSPFVISQQRLNVINRIIKAHGL